jgi:hypothetical protein
MCKFTTIQLTFSGSTVSPQSEGLTFLFMHTFVHTQIITINKRRYREELETGSYGMCNLKFSVVQVCTTLIGALLFVRFFTTIIDLPGVIR